jgi:hypothetical protein
VGSAIARTRWPLASVDQTGIGAVMLSILTRSPVSAFSIIVSPARHRFPPSISVMNTPAPHTFDSARRCEVRGESHRRA